MRESDWRDGTARALTVFLNGEAIPGSGTQRGRVVDDSFVLLFNADHERRTFVLPPPPFGQHWVLVLDTSDGLAEGEEQVKAEGEVSLGSRSLVLLRRASG
jgi:glycogen operon protein